MLANARQKQLRVYTYIVDVYSLSVNRNNHLVSLSLLRLGQAIDITNVSLSGGRVQRARQLGQYRRRLKIHCREEECMRNVATDRTT